MSKIDEVVTRIADQVVPLFDTWGVVSVSIRDERLYIELKLYHITDLTADMGNDMVHTILFVFMPHQYLNRDGSIGFDLVAQNAQETIDYLDTLPIKRCLETADKIHYADLAKRRRFEPRFAYDDNFGMDRIASQVFMGWDVFYDQ